VVTPSGCCLGVASFPLDFNGGPPAVRTRIGRLSPRYDPRRPSREESQVDVSSFCIDRCDSGRVHARSRGVCVHGDVAEHRLLGGRRQGSMCGSGTGIGWSALCGGRRAHVAIRRPWDRPSLVERPDINPAIRKRPPARDRRESRPHFPAHACGRANLACCCVLVRLARRHGHLSGLRSRLLAHANASRTVLSPAVAASKGSMGR